MVRLVEQKANDPDILRARREIYLVAEQERLILAGAGEGNDLSSVFEMLVTNPAQARAI